MPFFPEGNCTLHDGVLAYSPYRVSQGSIAHSYPFCWPSLRKSDHRRRLPASWLWATRCLAELARLAKYCRGTCALIQTDSQCAQSANSAQGPVTEECLFRSAVVPLLLLAKASSSSIIFLSPLAFGGAHIHHFYEFRIMYPRVPIYAAIARTVLQLGYTSIFGAYATFLFLQTGSLLAVILVHAFCNSLGLPRVWGYMEPYWLPSATSKSTQLKWTIPYYMLLVGGLALWWKNLYTLTDSSTGLRN